MYWCFFVRLKYLDEQKELKEIVSNAKKTIKKVVKKVYFLSECVNFSWLMIQLLFHAELIQFRNT